MKLCRAAALLLVMVPACTGGDSSGAYRDPAGWSAEVPAGWHVEPFETSQGQASSVGTQISNVDLPAPTIHVGLPIQASGLVLPPDGVAIVIASDDDPRNVQRPPAEPSTPPLSLDGFDEGSSTGGGASLSLLWFDCGGRTLLISIRRGSEVGQDEQAAIADVIGSIRCEG